MLCEFLVSVCPEEYSHLSCTHGIQTYAALYEMSVAYIHHQSLWFRVIPAQAEIQKTTQ